MNNVTKNVSVYFKDSKGNSCFLFQIINIGKDNDDLKFVFNDPESGTRCIFTPENDVIGDGSEIRRLVEITYHNDGSILMKGIAYHDNPLQRYHNPSGVGVRRNPLGDIKTIQPFIRIRIYDYKLCIKSEPSNPRYISDNPKLFNGEPIECIISLLRKGSDYKIPVVASKLILEDVAISVDISIMLHRLDSSGEVIQVDGINGKVTSTNTRIEVVEWENGDPEKCHFIMC